MSYYKPHPQQTTLQTSVFWAKLQFTAKILYPSAADRITVQIQSLLRTTSCLIKHLATFSASSTYFLATMAASKFQTSKTELLQLQPPHATTQLLPYQQHPLLYFIQHTPANLQLLLKNSATSSAAGWYEQLFMSQQWTTIQFLTTGNSAIHHVTT